MGEKNPRWKTRKNLFLSTEILFFKKSWHCAGIIQKRCIMKKCKMLQSRAGTGTTSPKKKVSRMTLTGILSLAAVFFMVISVQAKNETATENDDASVMKMAQKNNPQGMLVAGTNELSNQNNVGAQWVGLTVKGDMNRAVCMVNDSFMLANTMLPGQNVNGLSAATYKSTTKTYIALAATNSVKLNNEAVAQITTKTSVVPADVLTIGNENKFPGMGISVAGNSSFDDDVYRSQLFTDRLGGERVLKTPSYALITGFDEGGGYPYSLANVLEEKGSDDYKVMTIV